MPEPNTIVNEYEQLTQALAAGQVPGMRKVRDLSLIPLLGGIQLVVACDSNASIGEKPADFKPFPYEEAAVSALKVPLMEVLAAGATPAVIVNNLCMEMEPTGKKIIAIMRAELERCGLWGKVQFTGSTEDNMNTTQTGMGVTAVGIATGATLRLGRTASGHAIVCVGIPQSGIRVPYSEKDATVAKIDTVQTLAGLNFVQEILPIGSKGAAYEAGELCKGKGFAPFSNPGVDLETSAGSSTAVLVSLHEEDIDALKARLNLPCNLIGYCK